MIDQAEVLRTLVKDRVVCHATSTHKPRVYTVAVTSGKGGVGKTSVAVNLAMLLARNGQRVSLIDADFGLSNAEVMLGVAPRYGLADVASGKVDICEAWVQVSGGLRLLSSGSGLEEMANIDGVAGVELMGSVLSSVSDGEIVVVDTAPGIDRSVISVLGCADEVMMVTTPEPTSITDTYAAIKVLTSYRPDIEITLVANCCASPGQADAVANGLHGICRRFLGRSFQRYEYLPRDTSVSESISSQSPLVLSSRHSAAVPWLRKMAIKLDDRIRRYSALNHELRLVGV